MTTQHDIGNNETVSIGYVDQGNITDGPRFLALTHVESRAFKTERGAIAWLKRRGYDAHGRRLKP